MPKIDNGPPDYRKNLPPIVEQNYGKWEYHESPRPGVLKHVGPAGALYSVRCASPRLVCVDFIRDVCALADKYCGGYLRFTSRNNIEFLVSDEQNVEPLIAECEAQGLPVDKLFILHLKKDGTYKLQPFDRDDALPEALLTLHSALKKKARKRNA